MSLKTRERVRPLRVFFSRSLKYESELGSSGPLFHEPRNEGACWGPVDLFFMSLKIRSELRPLRVFFSRV